MLLLNMWADLHVKFDWKEPSEKLTIIFQISLLYPSETSKDSKIRWKLSQDIFKLFTLRAVADVTNSWSRKVGKRFLSREVRRERDILKTVIANTGYLTAHTVLRVLGVPHLPLEVKLLSLGQMWHSLVSRWILDVDLMEWDLISPSM